MLTYSASSTLQTNKIKDHKRESTLFGSFFFFFFFFFTLYFHADDPLSKDHLFKTTFGKQKRDFYKKVLKAFFISLLMVIIKYL